MSVAENIARVRENMERAAASVGRRSGEIALVGASKMNDAAACREAVAAGIDALGENRVQEMSQKLAEHAYDGAPLHFIGHLQRNKVRQVVGRVALIQSAGTDALLREIEKEAARYARILSGEESGSASGSTVYGTASGEASVAGTSGASGTAPSGADALRHGTDGGSAGFVQPVLLEVNIGGEEAKSGFLPEDLIRGAEIALSLPHIRVEGLMTIPPADANAAETRRYFDKVYALYVDIAAKLFHNGLTVLSMGMSGDYEDAIRAGATMVRVGTAIFGTRRYQDA